MFVARVATVFCGGQVLKDCKSVVCISDIIWLNRVSYFKFSLFNVDNHPLVYINKICLRLMAKNTF